MSSFGECPLERDLCLFKEDGEVSSHLDSFLEETENYTQEALHQSNILSLPYTTMWSPVAPLLNPTTAPSGGEVGLNLGRQNSADL